MGTKIGLHYSEIGVEAVPVAVYRLSHEHRQ